MIVVALVSAYPAEAEARAACAAEHGHGDLPYMGIWAHPTPERPLVHIFSNQTSDQLEDAGWTCSFDELSETHPGSGIYE